MQRNSALRYTSRPLKQPYLTRNYIDTAIRAQATSFTHSAGPASKLPGYVLGDAHRPAGSFFKRSSDRMSDEEYDRCCNEASRRLRDSIARTFQTEEDEKLLPLSLDAIHEDIHHVIRTDEKNFTIIAGESHVLWP